MVLYISCGFFSSKPFLCGTPSSKYLVVWHDLCDTESSCSHFLRMRRRGTLRSSVSSRPHDDLSLSATMKPLYESSRDHPRDDFIRRKEWPWMEIDHSIGSQCLSHRRMDGTAANKANNFYNDGRSGQQIVLCDRKFAMHVLWLVETHGINGIPPHASILINWIKCQRVINNSGKLKMDRKDKLNEIDFMWSAISISVRTDAWTFAWDQHYAMYRDFVVKNGITCRPKPKSSMGIWVYTQRKMKRLGMLKKDRLVRLWSARSAPRARTVSWDQNFAMYRDFAEKNGICCAPKSKSSMDIWIIGNERCTNAACWRTTEWISLTKLAFSGLHPVIVEKIMPRRLRLQCIAILLRRMEYAALWKRNPKLGIGFISNEQCTG